MGQCESCNELLAALRELADEVRDKLSGTPFAQDAALCARLIVARNAIARHKTREDTRPMYDAADAYALRFKGYFPGRLAAHHDGRTVELVSYAFPTTDGRALHVMVRLTPGDPTTITEVACATVLP